MCCGRCVLGDLVEVPVYDKPGRPKTTKTKKYSSIGHEKDISPMYGPNKLYILNGQCFNTSIEKFEYKVCPFQNATQGRITATRPQLAGFDAFCIYFSIVYYTCMFVKVSGEIGRLKMTFKKDKEVLLRCDFSMVMFVVQLPSNQRFVSSLYLQLP